MKTLADLANRLMVKANEVESAGVLPATECALAIVKYLAYNTPVDSSKALSNWSVFVGNYPVGYKIEAHYYGFEGTTRKVSAEKTIALAIEKLKDKKAGEPIYIVNFQPYIVRLNEGHSKQVAPGFIERGILQGRLAIKK